MPESFIVVEIIRVVPIIIAFFVSSYYLISTASGNTVAVIKAKPAIY